MLLPVVDTHGGDPHDPLAAVGGMSLDALGLAAVHTAAMLATMAVVAVVVYEVVGVGFLRRGWVNVDRVWAGALVTAGSVTLIT